MVRKRSLAGEETSGSGQMPRPVGRIDPAEAESTENQIEPAAQVAKAKTTNWMLVPVDPQAEVIAGVIEQGASFKAAPEGAPHKVAPFHPDRTRNNHYVHPEDTRAF